MDNSRSSLAITISVWKALFLREALFRISRERMAWAWLLFEPIIQMGILLFIFIVIRMRTITGMDIAVWLMVGLLGMLMFNRTSKQTEKALSANQNLFSYRQVKPVDTLLVRGAVEGILTALIAILVFIGAALMGVDDVPAAPLALLVAFFGLWLLGLGFGLMVSVVDELLPEVGKIIQYLMTPMNFASGVIIPLTVIPEPYRAWLYFNPVADGLESAREAMTPFYQVEPASSIAYTYQFALVMIFLGLALQVHFKEKLVMR